MKKSLRHLPEHNMQRVLPKFNRQRFLLYFIEKAGGTISKLDFQKLLFLCEQRYKFSLFEFIPYLYGCYSFQASSDLEVLQMQGWISTDETTITLSDAPPRNAECGAALEAFFRDNPALSGNDLIRSVYRRHPYYAINSRIAQNLLDAGDLEKVRSIRTQLQKTTNVLYTLGYEGITFEAYVNALIRNDVRVLCDVRNNPLSRKFGFSKTMLSAVLPKIGILYVHLPELGIISSKRQQLETETDYEALFSDYARSLPEKQGAIDQVLKLLHDHHRVSLTCFEKDPAHCHRHVLAGYLNKTYSVDVCDL